LYFLFFRVQHVTGLNRYPVPKPLKDWLDHYILMNIVPRVYCWYSSLRMADSWMKVFNNSRSRHFAQVKEEEYKLKDEISDIYRKKNEIGPDIKLVNRHLRVGCRIGTKKVVVVIDP
jgi:hypothetical protein